MQIRLATPADHPTLWTLLEAVIRAGETYTLPPDMTAQEATSYWTSPDKTTFVLESEGRVVGTYYIRPNQLGNGDHICNCGYVSAAKGAASAMCEHSLEYARSQGYLAMQFNFVIESNQRAVRLWQRFGFQVVGRIPQAFRHPGLGMVNALVMHRTL